MPGNWIGENVPFPWAWAETRECGAFVVGCTAGFDVSELQGLKKDHRDTRILNIGER